MTDANVRRRLLLAVFVLSGFAGLIYQSIWSHYLGLFLGHAAYAQALVLALFMGGMALGSAWIARIGVRWRNLLRGYAVVELVIGCLGLIFHPLFVATVDLGYEQIIPAIGAPWAVSLIKWLMAAVLILPQTILLGMTFPLMSGGLIRRHPGQDGQLLGGLYFSNSMGAAVGALVSVFVLIPAVGLPGASMTAGVFNIIVAALAWWLARQPETPPAPLAHEVATGKHPLSLLRLVLWGTAVSGAASFIYEIVWIRMLAMAVGSTMHAFELMLAAFIAGIALGGLWVRARADRATDPLRLVGWMQIGMALAALLSLVLYAESFTWVSWLMHALTHSDGGYALFNLGTAGIAIAIMLPTAFFAGTTLPLFTVALLRSGFGERAIGRVYAWNTLGAIGGVFLAIHVLIPSVGLKLALCVGALLDLLIGLWLLRVRLNGVMARWRFAMAAAVAVLALALAVTQVRFDPLRLASGVFRNGKAQLDPSNRVVFYRDGKTASVSVIATPDGRAAIATNGKVDAGLTVTEGVPPISDELTMMLAAALPMAMHPDPERVGIIGLGSGMTTHTVLGDARLDRVDTVEIEAAMAQGAQAFGYRVIRAYNDPRSHIVIDDAKAYFASQQQTYDVIISEPSNPWISGVASLFSKEFYRFIPKQLKPNGLFVQWVQLYEIDNRLVASVLKALTPEFGDYAAWLSNGTDMIIIATPAKKLPPMNYERILSGAIGAEMQYLGITRPEQMHFHKVADARMLRALARMYDVPVNSDYHPVLALQAPKTRYLRKAAGMFTGFSVLQFPLLEMLGVRPALPTDVDLPYSDLFPAEATTVRARQSLAYVLGKGDAVALQPAQRNGLAQWRELIRQCPSQQPALGDLMAGFEQISASVIAYLPAAEFGELWALPDMVACRTSNRIVDHAAALLESTSQRDAEAMQKAARAWFDLRRRETDAALAVLDEPALYALMLGAAARDDWAAVCRAEANHGGLLARPDNGAADPRGLLLAMARGELAAAGREQSAAVCGN